MKKLQLQVIALLMGLAMFSSSRNLNGEVVSGSGSCESLLAVASEQVKQTSAEARTDIWKNLRALRKECETPGTDPVVGGRAALLYLTLPEFNTPTRELEVLSEQESRLRGVEGAQDVLISLLDRSSGQLFVARRYEEARAKFEEALQLRRAHFGAGSLEESVGLLYLGQFYSGLALESGKPADVQRSLEFGRRAIDAYLESHEPADARAQELVGQVEALIRSLPLSAQETSALVESLPRVEQPL